MAVLERTITEFSEVYSNYYSVVYSAVYTKVGNSEDTEDITQEVFIRYYKKMDEIENSRKWLYGALKLVVLEYYRKKKPADFDIDEVFSDIALTFVNGFRDTRIIINEAIEEMDNYKDDIDRIIFDLIAVQNFTYKNAGKQLGLTRIQVRYRYGLIVRSIKDSLRKKGIKSLEELL